MDQPPRTHLPRPRPRPLNSAATSPINTVDPPKCPPSGRHRCVSSSAPHVPHVFVARCFSSVAYPFTTPIGLSRATLPAKPAFSQTSTTSSTFL